MQSVGRPGTKLAARGNSSRPRQLQVLGILSGFTAGAWLGAAEAPTKLVSIGVSPLVISLIMVDRRFSGALEPARLDSGHVFGPRRPSPRASPHHLGAARGMSLGRGQHHDHLRHSRYRPEHRLPSVEFKQPAGHFVGLYFLQRIAPGRLAALDRRARRRAGHVRRRRTCWRSLPRRRRPPLIPCAEFGPRWARVFSGARCTFPIARPICPE